MKSLGWKVGEVINISIPGPVPGIFPYDYELILGVILDLYSKKEDLCRYYKALVDVDPSMLKNKEYHKIRYKVCSGRYREHLAGGRTQCLILVGDQKHMLSTSSLLKVGK